MGYNPQKIIEFFKQFRINRFNFENEAELEAILVPSLKKLLKEDKVRVKVQSKSVQERTLIPDITIGKNQILLEIKYLRKNINDIYRMYYQAIKYSKMAKDFLIFFVYDPNGLLTYPDKEDLERSDKIIVIHKRWGFNGLLVCFC